MSTLTESAATEVRQRIRPQQHKAVHLEDPIHQDRNSGLRYKTCMRSRTARAANNRYTESSRLARGITIMTSLRVAFLHGRQLLPKPLSFLCKCLVLVELNSSTPDVSTFCRSNVSQVDELQRFTSATITHLFTAYQRA